MISKSATWTLCAIGALALGILTNPLALAGQERAPVAVPKPVIDKMHLRMQPEEAAPNGSTVLMGNSSQEGFYVYRNHFGPHQTSKPHYHDKDRYVTVIRGTWYTGEGDRFQPDKMVPIKTGGFMFHPAGLHHYDGSCDDQDVIVQIMGYGPVHTTQSEVDDKGQPAFANPANPNKPAGRDTRGCKGSVKVAGEN